MSEQVLVTGASGFVCSHIVDALLESGYRVVALDRAFDPTHLRRWMDQPVAFVEGDISALPDLDVDAVIHGAAVTAGPEERGETPEANLHANLDPALAVSEWAARQGARRVVFISSSAVARTSSAPRVTEDASYEALGLYSVAKQAIEGLARTLRLESGRDTLAVRLGYLYGPYEYRRSTRPRVSLVARLIDEAVMQGRVTVAAASAPTDWTYVGDVGRAMVALLQAPRLRHALYHLSSGQALSQLDIAQTLQRALPHIELDTTAEAPAFRGVLVGERLHADTGFDCWTDFADGLAVTLRWFRQQLEQTR